MKKLMIGLVGALAFAVGAEVASENIVGFNEESMHDNANFTAAMFDEIGSEGMGIQKIIPKGDDMYGGAVSIKLLNANLGDLTEYYYLPIEEAPEGMPAGWYENDYTTLADVVFDAGAGFILINNLESASRCISGEVKFGKTTWELVDNANMTGNLTPSPLDIQNVWVGTGLDGNGDLTQDPDEIYGGAFSLKMLNQNLGDLVEYFYLPAVEAPDGETPGWYENDYTTLASKQFTPGEGFFIVNNLPNAWAQIPAALTK